MSSDGPTAPDDPAGANVWQLPQPASLNTAAPSAERAGGAAWVTGAGSGAVSRPITQPVTPATPSRKSTQSVRPASIAGSAQVRRRDAAHGAAQRLHDVGDEKQLRCAEDEHDRDGQRVQDAVPGLGQDGEAPRRSVEALPEPDRRVEVAEDEGQPDVPLRHRVAPERAPRQLGQEVVDGPEDDQADVQERHLVEVADDPERVVDDRVEDDRRVDDARETGQEPADEAEEERGRRARPVPVRAVDREARL